MSPKKIKKPNALNKGEILFGDKTSSEKLSRLGKVYEEQDNLYDAIDFYERAKDKEAAAALAQIARKQGNAFLLKKCLRVTETELSAGEWNALATEAEAAGNKANAAIFYQEGGQPQETARVREEAGIVVPSLDHLGAEPLQETEEEQEED